MINTYFSLAKASLASKERKFNVVGFFLICFSIFLIYYLFYAHFVHHAYFIYHVYE